MHRRETIDPRDIYVYMYTVYIHTKLYLQINSLNTKVAIIFKLISMDTSDVTYIYIYIVLFPPENIRKTLWFPDVLRGQKQPPEVFYEKRCS